MTTLQFWFLICSAALCIAALLVGWRATRIKALPPAFDHWLRSPMVNNLAHVNSSEIAVKATTPNLEIPERLLERVGDAIRAANSVDLTVDDPFDGALVLSADSRFAPANLRTSLEDARYRDNWAAHFAKVRLRARRGDVVFNGVSIHEIIVGPHFQGRLTLVNCWVRIFSLTAADSTSPPSIEIENTCIGDFVLASGSCRDLLVSGGHVNHVKCTVPTSASPFNGTVTFVSNPSLRSARGLLLNDAQEYRNLSMHLSKVGNIVAAKEVQVFEKRMERPGETPTIRFISFMYDAMSLYGNAPGRAVLWLVAIMAYTTALFFVFNSAELTEPCSSLVGWQVGLCGDRAEARALRAALISVDATLNPLSILTKSHVVTASNIVLHSYLFLVGLTAIALIAQAGIGIRRRFISQ